MKSEQFHIGELSRRTGVKITTIRYFEHAGLMPEPPRTASARRLYAPKHVRRLHFIGHARRLGFSTDEVRALLRLDDSPELSCKRVETIAKQRLHAVEEKLALLERLRAELSRMIAQCHGGRVAQCHIIETLTNESRLARTTTLVRNAKFS